MRATVVGERGKGFEGSGADTVFTTVQDSMASFTQPMDTSTEDEACADVEMQPAFAARADARDDSPPQVGGKRAKLKVILDLDETLIHCKVAPGADAAAFGCHSMAQKHQEGGRMISENVPGEIEVVQVQLEDENMHVVNVYKRPGVDRFLRIAAEKYELYALTASEGFYARPLLRLLDPTGKIFRGQYYRDSCRKFREGIFAKDLLGIFPEEGQSPNRAEEFLSRIVLVDNNPLSFIPQPDNGVPIVSWYENPRDTALDVLLDFLSKLNKLDDVRPMLQETFHISAALNNYLMTIPSGPAFPAASSSATVTKDASAPSTGAPRPPLPPPTKPPSVVHSSRKDAVTPSRPLSAAETRPPLAARAM